MTALERYDEAVGFFLDMSRNNGKSTATIRNHENNLRYFRDFMVESCDFEHDPSVTDIREYADTLERLGKAKSTIKRYLVDLKCFFSFVSDETLDELRYYESNPVSKRLIPDLSKENKRPYDLILSDEQAAKLWKNEPVPGSRKWARTYAVVMVLLTTEIRNAELLSLTPNDLDFENGELVVERGKGNKFRIVDFPEIAQTAVKLYLASGLRPAYAKDTDPLFGTEAENVFGQTADIKKAYHKGSTQWLSNIVENHVRTVTGVPNVRSHDLRHVGSRLDLNNGMHIEELQAKLGHSSPETTQRYCGLLAPRSKRKTAQEAFAIRDAEAELNNARLAIAM